MYLLCEELNKGLGKEEYNFAKELGLSIITCGMYSLYFFWRVCNSVVELQTKWGVKPAQDAPILFILMLVFLPAGFYLVQDGLNKAWETGTPGGAGGYGG